MCIFKVSCGKKINTDTAKNYPKVKLLIPNDSKYRISLNDVYKIYLENHLHIKTSLKFVFSNNSTKFLQYKIIPHIEHSTKTIFPAIRTILYPSCWWLHKVELSECKIIWRWKKKKMWIVMINVAIYTGIMLWSC